MRLRDEFACNGYARGYIDGGHDAKIGERRITFTNSVAYQEGYDDGYADAANRLDSHAASGTIEPSHAP